ncbi:hypothetical protein MFLAVUS_003817 [Mucor flavus]|uniref:Uncharacterized protein n=1 Tax=Mucor flavus TaxID=439312 RepID=A0ABP9YU79_9FUNG
MASVEDFNYSSGSDTEPYFDACESEPAQLNQPNCTLQAQPDYGKVNLEANLVKRMLQEAQNNNEIPLSVSDIDRELVALEETERQRVEVSSRFGEILLAARKMLNAGRWDHKELKLLNEDRKIALIKARDEANGYTAEELEHTIKTEPTSFNLTDSEMLEPAWLLGPSFEQYRKKQIRKKEKAKRILLQSSTDRPELPSQRRDKLHFNNKKWIQRPYDRERERSDVGRSRIIKKGIRQDVRKDKKLLMNAFKKLKMES